MAFLLALISASLCLTSTAHDLDCLKPGATTPHETDCRSYYKCGEYHKNHLFKCLEGESFNAAKEICDASENVKCSGLDEKDADSALFNIKELLDKLPDILSGVGGEHPHTPEEFGPRPDVEHKEETSSVQKVVNHEEGSKQIEKRNTDGEVNDEESLEMKPAEGEGSNDTSETKAETEIEGTEGSMHEEEESDNHKDDTEQKGNEETEEAGIAEKIRSHEEESEETTDHDEEEKEETGPIQTHDIVSHDVYSGVEKVMLPFGAIVILKKYEDESRESFENEKEEGLEKSDIESVGNVKEGGGQDEVEGLKEEAKEHEESDKVNNDDVENVEHEDDEEKKGQVEAEVQDDGMKDDEHEFNKENEEEKMEEKEEAKVNDVENLKQESLTTSESSDDDEATSTGERSNEGNNDDAQVE